MGTNALTQALGECLADAMSALSTDMDPEPVLAQKLGEVLHADFWAVGRYSTLTGEAHFTVRPHPLDVGILRQATKTRRLLGHPVLDHWMQGHTDAAMVSTVVRDGRAWRNGQTYAVLKRALGCTESGGVRLDAGSPTIHMIGLARHADFSRDDVAGLNLFRAPMVALVGHAEWLRRKRRTGQWAQTTLPATASVPLTTRELQVLELLAEGQTAASIARRLRVSIRTVHAHLAHIYDKLGVHDRLSAVLRARRAGLLELARVDSTVVEDVSG